MSNLGRFEREPTPLKFKVEDMVMGYHSGHSVWMLVAGKIVKVNQATGLFGHNSYEVELIDELLDEDIKKKCILTLEEGETRPFNRDRVLKAIEYWKNEMRLRGEASEEHIKMRKELYPEDYQDKERLKGEL